MRDEFREHPPHSLDVPRGGESVIPCRPPRGKPDPRVRWMKDGDPVQTSSRISVEDSGTLRIRATDRDDMGVYVCVAHNTAGEKESIPCQLTVKGKLLFLILARRLYSGHVVPRFFCCCSIHLELSTCCENILTFKRHLKTHLFKLT